MSRSESCFPVCLFTASLRGKQGSCGGRATVYPCKQARHGKQDGPPGLPWLPQPHLSLLTTLVSGGTWATYVL